MQEDLRAQIENMIALVDHADVQAHQGIIVDMSALEGDVNLLCQKVTQSDPVIARNLQPSMADLISKLDALAASLEDFKARYKDE